MKDRLEKLIQESYMEHNCMDDQCILPCEVGMNKIIKAIKKEYVHESEVFATVKQIEDSGYVHIDEVLECLPKDIDLNDSFLEIEGLGKMTMPEKVCFNEALNKIRQALKNLGKH